MYRLPDAAESENAMKNSQSTALDALKQASKGLMMPSENDAPFEAIQLDGEPTSERLRQWAGASRRASVEELTLDDLFATVPSEDRAKFQRLRRAIEANLSEVKAFKIGDEAAKAIIIAGKASDGKWAGLKATVVET
jgi:hypothetical protein